MTPENFDSGKTEKLNQPDKDVILLSADGWPMDQDPFLPGQQVAMPGGRCYRVVGKPGKRGSWRRALDIEAAFRSLRQTAQLAKAT